MRSQRCDRFDDPFAHVVDQDVNPAELSDRSLDDPSTFRAASQVRPDRERAPTQSLDRCHRPPCGLRVDQVPQFVTFGVDDNPYSGLDGSAGDGGMKFVTDLAHDRVNPDGTRTTISESDSSEPAAVLTVPRKGRSKRLKQIGAIVALAGLAQTCYAVWTDQSDDAAAIAFRGSPCCGCCMSEWPCCCARCGCGCTGKCWRSGGGGGGA